MLAALRSSVRRIATRHRATRKFSSPADAAPASSAVGAAHANDASLFSQVVFDERKAFLRAFEQKKGAKTLYPPFVAQTSVSAYLEEWKDLKVGEKVPEREFVLQGRVMSKRDASRKLVFYIIKSDNRDVQIVANLAEYKDGEEEFNLFNRNLRRGDIICSYLTLLFSR